VRDVRTPTTEAARERALDTAAQLRGFFAGLDAMQCGLPIKIALPLILATAARPGEVCSMRWSHVDLESATWQLPEALDKMGKGRTIPLSPFALDLLGQAKAFTIADKPDVIFPAVRRDSIKDDHLHRALREQRQAFADNGVAPFTPHDLRRTARTWLAMLKVPDRIGELALGHAYGSRIERTYNTHGYDDEIRAAMDLLGAHLTAMRAGPNVHSLKVA
jgi:integrase